MLASWLIVVRRKTHFLNQTPMTVHLPSFSFIQKALPYFYRVSAYRHYAKGIIAF